ncbi:hypothetical protein Tel_01940 [Candidatus Tenderia electrophaga]|uniref:Topoisomerase II n=1 Tax=Candidatus Tenderia electrophaga TaxID=1748243 RepID=A0A0S2THN8_9GAMM|nr:hypothetical protein Tel_01940 [Candidatus Tenderia electrophaga]
MASRKLHVILHISADEYLKFYSGAASTVVATTRNGLSIEFPAHILRPYVRHDGIHGEFVIEFDDNNKFVAIDKLQ